MVLFFVIRATLRRLRRLSNQRKLEQCCRNLTELKNFISAMENNMERFPPHLKDKFRKDFKQLKSSCKSNDQELIVLKARRRVKSRLLEDLCINVELDLHAAKCLENDVYSATVNTDYAIERILVSDPVEEAVKEMHQES